MEYGILYGKGYSGLFGHIYLSFIVDYAQAKAFRAKKGYNQAPKQWEDILVEVFID